MTTLHDLMDMVEGKAVLVFPTEESARAFSTQYVLERKRGLLASSCIAFDRFAELFMPSASPRVQAGDMERAIFSAYAASSLSLRMRYLSSPSYPEMRSRLAAFFRPILPGLDEALAMPKKSRSMADDLRLLRSEYGRYLESAGLYEGAFQKLSEPDLAGRRYAVIMPSAFPKEERVMNMAKDSEGIHTIDDLMAPCPNLKVFSNEKSEIRALFLELRRLSDSGVPLSDIAVSAAPLERLRPYLEDEAYLFGIPLDFREGLRLLSTAPGAFLKGLSSIYSSSYSLDSLKAFMLDPAIPFKDSRAMRRFIAAAVRFSITGAPDRSDDRYMRLPRDAGVESYRLMRLTLDRLMAERDPARIEPYIHTLMSGLLVDEEFRDNDEDAAIYSFLMKSLSDFLDAYAVAKEAGFGSDEPVFPLFMDYAETLRYVPRTRVKGVAVYPFTQDAAIPFPHRFIIGLNSKEGAETVKKASFLSDYEIDGDRSELDITKTILSLYAAMTDDLHLSASYETYAGFALPLTFMLSSAEKAGPSASDDPLRGECSSYRGRLLPVQRRGYRRAELASLRKRREQDDMTMEHRGRTRPLPVPLSYTSFNAYARCPYMHAMQYAFSLRNLPSYEPVDLDHLEIGSRLHSILERCFRIGAAPEDIPGLFDEEMQLWSDGRRFSRDGSIEDMPSSATRPTVFLISYLRARYLPRLKSVVERMFAQSVPLEGGRGLECALSMEFADEGFSLDGRVDRIAASPDGSSLLIYDYKKGRRMGRDKTEKSYQFHIYRLLIEASREFDLPVSKAFFVSLLDGVFSESSEAPDRKDLIEALSAAAHGIADGDWHANPSSENCSGCAYRGICRRRFSVR